MSFLRVLSEFEHDCINKIFEIVAKKLSKYIEPDIQKKLDERK